MQKPHPYIIQFFISLTIMLGLVMLVLAGYYHFATRPVMVDLGGPFKVLTKNVKPGDTVQYHIHYFKRLDIPGDITKQLVLTRKDTGEVVYIPLADTAGHLPIGEIYAVAYATIPDWTPEGTGYIKLSSTYNLGWTVSHNVARTEKFVVRAK